MVDPRGDEEPQQARGDVRPGHLEGQGLPGLAKDGGCEPIVHSTSHLASAEASSSR